MVSYLTAEEVAEEVGRVGALDLSHREQWLTRERQQYRKLLEQAREGGDGVVTFYS